MAGSTIVGAGGLRQRDITIRDATPDDAPFVAWVMQTAARSHLDHSIWEYMNQQTEAEVIELLADMAVTDSRHLFHHSLFLIAEVDGEPSAGLCGYDPETEGFPAFLTAAPPVFTAHGFAADDPERMRRGAVIGAGWPVSPAVRPWTIENVATVAQYRRLGLVRTLLDEVLERGRAKGFTTAQIGVFIGNEPARQAYLKAGFTVAGEKRDPGFAAAMGCPGAEVLLREL